MAGLLRRPLGNGQQMPPTGGMGMARQAGAADEDSPNVAPEEQAQYDRFMNNAFKAVYSKGSLPKVLERLQRSAKAGDPKEGVAAVASMVVMRIEDSARKGGVQLSDDVVFHAGREIVEDLADLAKKAKIHDFSDEETEGAFYRALDLYRDVKAKKGGIDQKAADQEFAGILQADREGRLDQMVGPMPPRGRGMMRA